MGTKCMKELYHQYPCRHVSQEFKVTVLCFSFQNQKGFLYVNVSMFISEIGMEIMQT